MGITSQEHPGTEDIRTIGRLIRQKRIAERLTLEQAAKQSGVSSATLSRLERQADIKTVSTKGFTTPDTRTLAVLIPWLGPGLESAIEHEAPTSITIVPRDVAGRIIVEGDVIGTRTPEVVEAFLRADRNLNPQTAEMLAAMFRLAYQQYSQLSEPVSPPPAPGMRDGKLPNASE